jgi:capsular polysaccharide biosynthesis protein
MFLINLAVVAPFALVELILPSNRRVIGPGGLPRAIPIYPNYFINIALMFIPTIVIAAYYSICFTLFYFDLRIRKEGFDLLLLAKPKLAPDDELA